MPGNLQTADTAEQDTVKHCGLRAVLTYADGSTEDHYVAFCPDLSDWQFVSTTIVPRKSEGTVSTIKVVCAYEGNANTAYFDNLSLVREAAQTMKYDYSGQASISMATRAISIPMAALPNSRTTSRRPAASPSPTPPVET